MVRSRSPWRYISGAELSSAIEKREKKEGVVGGIGRECERNGRVLDKKGTPGRLVSALANKPEEPEEEGFGGKER